MRHHSTNPSHDSKSVCTGPTVDTKDSLGWLYQWWWWSHFVFISRVIWICFWSWIRIGN
jgi:hypothetical protein